MTRHAPGFLRYADVASSGTAERSRALRELRAHAAAGRRDQHPVHQRHDGPAEGRHALASQHRQQRLLRRAAHDVHRGRPAVHSRAAVSLLRHGDGRARLRDARRRDGVSRGEAFEPKSVLEAVAAERCTALYGVPTMFIAELEHPEFRRYDLRSLRTGVMAGAPCPVEVMKRVIADMHMQRSHDLLRHDGDEPGQLPEPPRRLAGTARRRRWARFIRISK